MLSGRQPRKYRVRALQHIFETYDYAGFKNQWGDFILDLTNQKDYPYADPNDWIDCTSEKVYREEYDRLMKNPPTVIYRGIAAPDNFVEMLAPGRTPLGKYWTTNYAIAGSFTRGRSLYDERFELGSEPLLLVARIDPGAMDINATIAKNVTMWAEQEVCLHAHASLTLEKVFAGYIDGDNVLPANAIGMYPV